MQDEIPGGARSEPLSPYSEASQKLEFDETFKLMGKILKRGWRKLTAFAALGLLGMFFYLGALGVAIWKLSEVEFDFEWLLEDEVSGIMLILSLGLLVAAIFFFSWAHALMAKAAHRAAFQEVQPAEEGLASHSSGVGKLFAYNLLWGGVGVFIALLLGIIFYYMIAEEIICLGGALIPVLLGLVVLSFWLSIKLGLVPFAVAVEGNGVFTGMTRSFELTRDNFWRTAGIILLMRVAMQAATSAVTSIIVYPLTMVIALGMSAMEFEPWPLVGILGFVLLVLIAVLTIIWEVVNWSAWGAVYVGLRRFRPEMSLSGESGEA